MRRNKMNILQLSNYIKLYKINDKVEKIEIAGQIYNVNYDIDKCKCIDGRYREIYIQISETLKLYYIGKSDKSSIDIFKRYQGSGYKFKKIYKSNKQLFKKYCICQEDSTIALCDKERTIINSIIGKDSCCLNKMRGGSCGNIFKAKKYYYNKQLLTLFEIAKLEKVDINRLINYVNSKKYSLSECITKIKESYNNIHIVDNKPQILSYNDIITRLNNLIIYPTKTRIYYVAGRYYSLKDLSLVSGLSNKLLYDRIVRFGWSIEDAVCTQIGDQAPFIYQRHK